MPRRDAAVNTDELRRDALAYLDEKFDARSWYDEPVSERVASQREDALFFRALLLVSCSMPFFSHIVIGTFHVVVIYYT